MLRLGFVMIIMALLVVGCSGGTDSDSEAVVQATTVAPMMVTDSNAAAQAPAATVTSVPPTWTPEPSLTPPPTRARVTSTPVPAPTVLPTVTPGTSPGLPTDLAPLTAANAAELTVIAEASHGAHRIAAAPETAPGAPGLLAAAEREGARLYANGDLAQPVRLLADRDDWVGHATNCVVFTPDGTRLLAGNTDGELRVWDVASYALLDVIPAHEGMLWDCAYSPDGSRLATGSDDNTVKLWDAADLSLLATLPIRDGRDSAYDVAWSPDGTLIGVGSNATSYVSVWDVAAQTMIFETRGYATMAWAVTFSPDGQWFVAGYDDGVARVYAVDDLRDNPAPVAELPGHEALVQSLVFTGDSTLLLAGASVGTLHVWDVATWTEVASLPVHRPGLGALYLSTDGTQLYTSGYDGTIKLWGIAAGA